MEQNSDLLTLVGQKCLQKVSELLDDKTAPAAATAETVKIYANIALAVEVANLRKAEQSRFSARAFRKQPFSPQVKENDIKAVAQAICDIQPTILKRFEKQHSGFEAREYPADHSPEYPERA